MIKEKNNKNHNIITNFSGNKFNSVCHKLYRVCSSTDKLRISSETGYLFSPMCFRVEYLLTLYTTLYAEQLFIQANIIKTTLS